jgi:L-lactate utilization protein LutB
MNLQTLTDNFTREGFRVVYFDTGAEAAAYIAGKLHGKTVGIGGSMTVEQLGLGELLGRDNTVYWHWTERDPELYTKAAAAQVYLCSANAVSETGELVNIDGSGNRVSATLYGHEQVIFLAGVNKVMPTLEAALSRAKNIAAPLNAKRLGRKTPCALSSQMRCYDCDSPERICRATVIINRKLLGVGEMELVLVGESLGY